MSKLIEFIPIGPIALPTRKMPNGGRRLLRDLQSRKQLLETDFWEEAQQTASKAGIMDLHLAKGVYVFGLRAGRGILPYYVGQASKSDFSTEPFNSSKIVHYNRCIGDRKGTPVMFFVVSPSKKGPTNKFVITAAEKVLIETAFLRNPDGLINKQHAKVKKWGIAGVIRSSKGKRSSASRRFGKMIGL